MNFTNSEMSEEESLREEKLLAEFTELTKDTCPNCGCGRGGGITCIRCGSLKDPSRSPIRPFSWADLLGAKDLPPAIDEVATIVVEKVDTKAVEEGPKATEQRTKQPKGASAQRGLFR